MARRRKPEAHANHERWLVSYADFITLLFAFFVVMFASGQTDKAKAKQVSDSVREALENGGITPAIAAILGGTVDEKGAGNAQRRGPGGSELKTAPRTDGLIEDLKPALAQLAALLKPDIERGKVQLDLQTRGLVISLREAAFYPSGDDQVLPQSFPMIAKLAEVVKTLPNPMRLEGHTDSVPISNARFRSNWELSAARSIRMLELLESRFAIPVSRMAVAGYADTMPAAPNDSDEGRAKNRRVDVVLLTPKGLAAEPTPKDQGKRGSTEQHPSAGGKHN
ncbi:MAG TPA: flagellar motor protein MotB [Bryobacteraceae bacterium]|nr:flagellar motor protein MotB [Bryobacteraceae bacterium]